MVIHISVFFHLVEGLVYFYSSLNHVVVVFYFRMGLLFDFLVVIVPVQLMMTVLSGHAPFCLFLLTLLIWITFNIKLRQENVWTIRKSLVVGEITMDSRRPFITYYRAFANVITAFSILAVDFKIFPRYFAKTETYGTGLMDVGVGGFLITNAIVSPEARGIASQDRSVKCTKWAGYIY